MDIEKMIEQLNDFNENHIAVLCGSGQCACGYLCDKDDCIVVRAATALSTLQGENAQLRAELERVKAERNMAVADVCVIIGEVEEIRRGYGVDNDDADSAFAGLCGNYCVNNGHFCYEESENYRCKHFKWRGMAKED